MPKLDALKPDALKPGTPGTDAVDRLMSLATAKAKPHPTADRPVAGAEQPGPGQIGTGASATSSADPGLTDPGLTDTGLTNLRPSSPGGKPLPIENHVPISTQAQGLRSAIIGNVTAGSANTTAARVSDDFPGEPSLLPPGVPKPSIGARGRQLLSALRPMLPAVAGALRLVDHGAVQAVARLLPLLSGVGAPVAGASASSASVAEGEQFLRGVLQLETDQQAMRKQLDQQALTIQELEATSHSLRQSLAQLMGEQTVAAHASDMLGRRVKGLTTMVILLAILVVIGAGLIFMLLRR